MHILTQANINKHNALTLKIANQAIKNRHKAGFTTQLMIYRVSSVDTEGSSFSVSAVTGIA